MHMATKQSGIDEIAADPRWTAVVERDPAAEGKFFYAVTTTGIYCRPTCPSRRPRRANVRFYPTATEAERDGFRPCRRCTPGSATLAERHAAHVAAACRLIEQAIEPLDLDTLAAQVGISPFHFHRIFKAHTGLTPKQYATAQRAGRVREELGRAGSVTDAIYNAGYNSNARFYEDAHDMLGMTPAAWRDGGRGAEIRFAIGECSLGSILVARSDRGICEILLGDDPEALARELQDRFPKARLIGGDSDFEQLVAEVVGFVEAPGLGFGLPLDVRGTAFQQRVWQALQRIPAGMTVSYADVAKQIGAPGAARAVAAACAANRLAVAIPCHRVVRSDGALSGVSMGGPAKARTVAAGGCGLNHLARREQASPIETRVKEQDWEHATADLNAGGVAVLRNLVTPLECAALAALYDRDEHFRSRVVMARHGFGQGEYRYFAYPLPAMIADLRRHIYPRLAPVANRWNESLDVDIRFPEDHAAFIRRCFDAGQSRPTPLLLDYGESDYNCLHQDLYGEHVFPLQVAILLSRPGTDFSGGEFVLTEQRPRRQSRVEVVPLEQGDAAIFAVHQRPVRGKRGWYRVNMRHGVSRVRSGDRRTLGIIFHDAA